MCDLSTPCQKVSLTPIPPCTSKTHQSSQSKDLQLVIVGYFVVIDGLVVFF